MPDLNKFLQESNVDKVNAINLLKFLYNYTLSDDVVKAIYAGRVDEIMLTWLQEKAKSYRIGVSNDSVFTVDISGSNGNDLSLNLITNHCQSVIPDYLYSCNQYMDSGDIFLTDGIDMFELIKFLIVHYQLNEITIKNNCLCLFHSRNKA